MLRVGAAHEIRWLMVVRERPVFARRIKAQRQVASPCHETKMVLPKVSTAEKSVVTSDCLSPVPGEPSIRKDWPLSQ